MVQYYQDLWAKHSNMLAPLTSLVGECGHTKVTRALKTRKVPWHWNEVHQRAFNAVKAVIAKDIALAYPDYSKEFEIYTDASSKQMGAVITQQNRPIAFFSRKLSETQQKYSVTEIELLAIVETLKEHAVGAKDKGLNDHKNLIQDALGLTSDRVNRWRLLLKEYGPEIIHIKGIHNTVAGAISCLDYSPVHNQRDTWMTFTQCWCHFASHITAASNIPRCEEEVIYPLTVNVIAEAQLSDPSIQKLASDKEYTMCLVENTQVLHKGTVMVVPTALCHRVISWYHHYLQHPGATCLEETL
eukprot:CCRYP_012047-RA/>CCRYP_012047-RA protein AED:0.17 eAED:0.16 QI:0/0/0/1/0/0/3/0/299